MRNLSEHPIDTLEMATAVRRAYSQEVEKSKAGDYPMGGIQIAALQSAADLLGYLYVSGLNMQGQWQPIETAICDGSDILCGAWVQGKWRTGVSVVSKTGGVRDWDWLTPATHWQPLPAPPVAAA